MVPLMLDTSSTRHEHPVNGVDLQRVESVRMLSFLHKSLPTHHIPTQKIPLSIGKQTMPHPKTTTALNPHKLLNRLRLVGPIRPESQLRNDSAVPSLVRVPKRRVAPPLHLRLHPSHDDLLCQGRKSLLEAGTHQRVRVCEHCYKSNAPHHYWTLRSRRMVALRT